MMFLENSLLLENPETTHIFQSVLVKFMDSGSESRQGSWGFLTFRTRNKEAQNQQMTVQVWTTLALKSANLNKQMFRPNYRSTLLTSQLSLRGKPTLSCHRLKFILLINFFKIYF